MFDKKNQANKETTKLKKYLASLEDLRNKLRREVTLAEAVAESSSTFLDKYVIMRSHQQLETAATSQRRLVKKTMALKAVKRKIRRLSKRSSLKGATKKKLTKKTSTPYYKVALSNLQGEASSETPNIAKKSKMSLLRKQYKATY